MKTVVIRGGLGNQLFSLAFADTVRHLSAEPVTLDVSSFGNDPHGRVFETAGLAQDFAFDVSSAHDPFRLSRILSRTRVNEPLPLSDRWDVAAFVRTSRTFVGYWQNERWIARPEFIREQTRAFLDSRAAAGPAHDVVIHYRCYREERVPGRREGPSAIYVARALEKIVDRLGPTTDIVLVSDDPSLALERLGELAARFAPQIGSATSDMSLMLSARALVLSNSSFSWWAGYCGDATFVAYPKRLGHFHYPEPASRFVTL